ncbi:MAG: hypothetical protein K0M63_06030 [Weeksellaceae bacterium]|nr:hypothetical protein [Weeksellaceae bacterium]
MKKFLFLFTLLLFCAVPAQKKMKDYSTIMKSNSIYEIDAFLRDAHVDDPRRSILKPRLMNMLKDYIKTAHPEDLRVREMQEKLALLKRRPSTKISFDEMNANIKQKQIKFYQEELARAQRAAANPLLGAQARIKVATPENNRGYAVSKSKSSAEVAAIRAAQAAVGKTSGAPAAPPIAGAAAKGNFANPEQEEFNLLMNPTVEDHKNQTVKILNALFDNDPTSKDTSVMIKNNSDCDIIMRMEGTGNTKYRLAIPARGENTIVILKGQYLFSSLVCGAQYASQKTVGKAIMVTLGSPGK